MHNFEYKENARKLLTPEIVNLLSSIYEHKGRQQLFVEAKKDELSSLLEIAKTQSTKSSNRIEGIFTTDKRLKELMQKKSEPRNRNEQEITGYRDVLSTIHENSDYISPTAIFIQQLHRDLYSYNQNCFGGKYKSSETLLAKQMEMEFKK